MQKTQLPAAVAKFANEEKKKNNNVVIKNPQEFFMA